MWDFESCTPPLPFEIRLTVTPCVILEFCSQPDIEATVTVGQLNLKAPFFQQRSISLFLFVCAIKTLFFLLRLFPFRGLEHVLRNPLLYNNDLPTADFQTSFVFSTFSTDKKRQRIKLYNALADLHFNALIYWKISICTTSKWKTYVTTLLRYNARIIVEYRITCYSLWFCCFFRNVISITNSFEAKNYNELDRGFSDVCTGLPRVIWGRHWGLSESFE